MPGQVVDSQIEGSKILHCTGLVVEWIEESVVEGVAIRSSLRRSSAHMARRADPRVKLQLVVMNCDRQLLEIGSDAETVGNFSSCG